MVQLAQEVRLGTVLRAAWYELCRSCTETPRIRSVDWTKNELITEKENWIKHRTANTALLDAGDPNRLLAARERMDTVAIAAIGDLSVDIECSAGGIRRKLCCKEGRTVQEFPCGESLTEWWGHQFSDLLAAERDPLWELLRRKQQLDEGSFSGSPLSYACVHCRAWLSRLLIIRSHNIWDMLDQIFDLQSLGIPLDEAE